MSRAMPGTCRASPSMFLSKWLAPFGTDLCMAVCGFPGGDRLLSTEGHHFRCRMGRLGGGRGLTAGPASSGLPSRGR